ncbi:MAG: RIP metalloprotease RseP [Bacteroidetes bacterium]|nr:MAG: RIP metalloprotease RseP [Bacteroidota bacterium]
MEFLSTIFYTVITLGVLVFIHELGHFLAAKLTGMRVDVFSIGFPPRAFGKKIGETDYCISWIPLGGYVKIAGMVDESFDTEFENREVQPWEFRAKPLWARSIVISAGVIMNLLLAVAIFWGIHFSRGKFIEETTEVGYVIEGSVAEQAGLRAGDNISSIDGTPVTHWGEVQEALYFNNIGNDHRVAVERMGITKEFTVPSIILTDSTRDGIGIIEAHIVAVIQSVEIGKPADKLGLAPGDIMVSINNALVPTTQEIIKTIRANAGKEITVQWKRNDSLLTGTTTVSEAGKIGISLGSIYTGPSRRIEYSFFEALSQGFREVIKVVDLIIQSIGNIIYGNATVKESFGGPIRIAQMATQSAEYGIASFLTFMAMLSVSLAVLNILPIPALDGGHLAIMIYEKITRKELSVKVKLGIQKVGFVLLLAFMAFVIYNDIASF